MLIKSRNFTANKSEESWEKSGFGWNPDYVKRFEGQGIDKIRYGKNFSQGTGVCKKCDKFTGKTGTKGEHCSLPANEHCQD